MIEDAQPDSRHPDWLIDGIQTILRSYQARWLWAAHGKDIAHRGARQVGKDRTWALEVAIDMAFRPRRQWSILSASQSHSKDFLADVVQHLGYLQKLTRAHSAGFPSFDKKTVEQLVLSNGSSLKAYSATPKNAQGRRGNIILNEIGIMPRAALIYETAEAVVRGQRNQGRDAVFRIIGNASPRGSFFHTFWTSKASDTFLKITSRWADCFRQWFTEDLGHPLQVTNRWIKDQIADMIARLGLAAFGQWYRCEWRNPKEGFFPPDLLTSRQYDPASTPDFPDLGDRRVVQSIGWDPSRRRHPAGICQALEGREHKRHYLHSPRRMIKWPWHQQENELARLVAQRRTIALVIDRQGIGDKPAEDAEARFGRIVEPYAFSAPRRMALFNNLLSQLEREVCWIPVNLDLRMELDGIQRTYNTQGVEGLVIPDSGDHHGDMAVAGALAEWGLSEPEAVARAKARSARKPAKMGRALARIGAKLR